MSRLEDEPNVTRSGWVSWTVSGALTPVEGAGIVKWIQACPIATFTVGCVASLLALMTSRAFGGAESCSPSISTWASEAAESP